MLRFYSIIMWLAVAAIVGIYMQRRTPVQQRGEVRHPPNALNGHAATEPGTTHFVWTDE